MGAHGIQRREVVLPGGSALPNVRFCLLQSLDRSGAGRRERLVAVELLLREI
jgi:hypothetical protein